jgi:hypothetical protein
MDHMEATNPEKVFPTVSLMVEPKAVWVALLELGENLPEQGQLQEQHPVPDGDFKFDDGVATAGDGEAGHGVVLPWMRC